MKILRFVSYLLFRHYSKVKYNPNPYLSTICILSIFAYFHLLQFLIITKTLKYFTSNGIDDSFIKKYFLVWILIPFGLLFSLLIPKKDLRKTRIEVENLKYAYIKLITYAVISFLLVFILAFWLYS
jgi:hypothetical protein